MYRLHAVLPGITAVLLLLACSGREQEVELSSGDRPAPATSQLQGMEPVPSASRDCPLPESAPLAPEGRLWWEVWDIHTPDYVTTRVVGAEGVVRSVVLREVRWRLEWGIEQYACILVREVYTGKGVKEGDVIVVSWSPPPPIDPPIIFDDRIGYVEGAEHIVLLRSDSWRARRDSGIEADFATWLGDVFPLPARASAFTPGPGGPPNEATVERLIAAIRSAPQLDRPVESILEKWGLERTGGMTAGRMRFPVLPDVPGTLLRYSASDPFLWYTEYRRVAEALRRDGFDWDAVLNRDLLAAAVTVRAINEQEAGAVTARLLVDDSEIVGAWLETENDVWALSEYASAQEAASMSAQPPARNRARGPVNLTEWYGIDLVIDVKIKTGNSAITDGTLSTAESIAAFAAALDRDLAPAPLDATSLLPGGDCAAVGLLLDRSDGYSFSLDYDPIENRLYAGGDGFSVEAPPEVAQLLGLVAYTAGSCPPPNPAKSP
ncbi:MAG TPA: hypothetical protein VFT91_02075 [Dehalococcoidia bacterium]|nr:hypothetical protein [Dehalococcoidia bacterium]